MRLPILRIRLWLGRIVSIRSCAGSRGRRYISLAGALRGQVGVTPTLVDWIAGSCDSNCEYKTTGRSAVPGLLTLARQRYFLAIISTGRDGHGDLPSSRQI